MTGIRVQIFSCGLKKICTFHVTLHGSSFDKYFSSNQCKYKWILQNSLINNKIKIVIHEFPSTYLPQFPLCSAHPSRAPPGLTVSVFLKKRKWENHSELPSYIAFQLEEYENCTCMCRYLCVCISSVFSLPGVILLFLKQSNFFLFVSWWSLNVAPISVPIKTFMLCSSSHQGSSCGIQTLS